MSKRLIEEDDCGDDLRPEKIVEKRIALSVASGLTHATTSTSVISCSTGGPSLLRCDISGDGDKEATNERCFEGVESNQREGQVEMEEDDLAITAVTDADAGWTVPPAPASSLLPETTAELMLPGTQQILDGVFDQHGARVVIDSDSQEQAIQTPSTTSNREERTRDGYQHHPEARRRRVGFVIISALIIGVVLVSTLVPLLSRRPQQPPAPPGTNATEAFQSLPELYSAVDNYLEDNSYGTSVADKYGWPIGRWNVSLVENFTR